MNNNSSHYRSKGEKHRRPRARIGVLAALATMAMLATACADDSPAGETGVKIVATTTILGDVAANVAGDSATVIVLLPRGADPHDYQASSREASDIVRSE